MKWEWLDMKIAISIALCMLTYVFVRELQVLSACTAALMCAQDGARPTWRSGLTRVLNTLVGGVLGVLAVLADNAIRNDYVFILLCAAGIVLTLAICRLMKLPPIAGRIGCITLVLIAVVAVGEGRIPYALNRLIATVYGAAVAMAVCGLSGLFAPRAASTVTRQG